MRRTAGLGLAFMAVLAGCGGGGAGSGSGGGGQRSTPPLPSGWKVVTRGEIGVDVPSDWLVKPWEPTCGVKTPTVYLGPEGQLQRCTTTDPGALVVIGAYAYTGPVKPVITHINGMEATEVVVHQPVTQPLSGTVTNIWVRLVANTPTGIPLGLFVSAGESTTFPGGGPGVAEKIASTIHGTVGSS